jgi:hypothetical protein
MGGEGAYLSGMIGCPALTNVELNLALKNYEAAGAGAIAPCSSSASAPA